VLYIPNLFYRNRPDGFLKKGFFRSRGIFAERNSKKHPHCHFERQREILNNQDFSNKCPG